MPSHFLLHLRMQTTHLLLVVVGFLEAPEHPIPNHNDDIIINAFKHCDCDLNDASKTLAWELQRKPVLPHLLHRVSKVTT